ncbi:MAG: hypothetical protein WCP21_18575 [Armatimonadota bacterium]
MNRRLVVVAAMGLAALLTMTSAMAQDKREGRDAPANAYAQRGKAAPRVMINGKENQDLSRRSAVVRDRVMVPDQPFFQAVGSDVRSQSGWVRPGSQQPERDRAEQWNVTQRNGRELRYRAGDPMYYYGGTPHYWTVPPYESGGSLYLSMGDLALTLGGGYNYNNGYNSGQVTLCNGGYCPATGELQMTYPYQDAYYRAQSQVVIQGYAAPASLVRIQVIEQMPFPFQNHTMFNQTMRVNNNGLYSVNVYVQDSGEYRANVDLLDPYGNMLNRQTSRFYVR